MLLWESAGHVLDQSDTGSDDPTRLPVPVLPKHSTGAVSDPEGSLTFIMRDPAQVNLYRFGQKITDFVICRTCGVYSRCPYARRRRRLW